MKNEFKIIANLLPSQSRVLDVGCGDGTLIKALINEKSIDARGIELGKNNVKECISKGLSVIEGNAETELSQFPDKAFDFVILSQTLQAFYQPENVLEQLLRIGHRVIISIPNFGYWQIRAKLLFFGKMPITKSLPYSWHDTPNLHMCSIKDFYQFCEKKKVRIDRVIGINGEKTSSIYRINLEMKNLFSEVGIFLIS
ncbi:MAG: methionine biosynthesis protein MetW [Pelagibacteraceae bacterium]|jgi:methionine biosynthesis protein MetW|nr:methionine biosynthesis protein MetW [Pelagibacteraceae bacterium]